MQKYIRVRPSYWLKFSEKKFHFVLWKAEGETEITYNLNERKEAESEWNVLFDLR